MGLLNTIHPLASLFQDLKNDSENHSFNIVELDAGEHHLNRPLAVGGSSGFGCGRLWVGPRDRALRIGVVI